MLNLSSIFRNLPIKWKLMVVTCAASMAALVTVAIALYFFQIQNFRTASQHELRTLAEIMADNCATALAFNDTKTAAEILAPLHFKSEIINASLMGKDNLIFATFGNEFQSPPPGSPVGILDRGATWTVVQPVVFDNQRIGTFLMTVDYARPRGELQRLYLAVTTVVLGGSMLLVVLLTLRLQSDIVSPIRLLASATEVIARNRDYSIRVSSQSRDECGQLTKAFNQMLGRIEEQDVTLHTFGDQLQDKVSALENEITERQRAEEALRRSQQKLLEISRLAGMAEVATEVLHNVGNVLNSVNVSAGFIHEKLRLSRVSKLVQAAELLTTRNGNLVEYLTQDPNGQKLPGYLTKLGQYLAAENIQLLSEVDRLSRNIEHIKEVVTMQQSYAKVSGVFEDLPLDRLVEDAISMNFGILEQQSIVLERRFLPTPLARVDRHSVLQIIINLVRNAKYALDAAKQIDKRIIFTIEPAGEGFARIRITDNGVGIAPENLVRIFGHGFTTRKDGHGFGLHSGATAIKEMGGSMSVHSDGIGCGATFTIELPIALKVSQL